ncbi:PAS domain S-box protein [Geobacter luticola]|uniref:histidine kinase n=2 Tax=Geomobilimonas luticola TaxID=1114878 RepID=A0ABS5SAW8_9BACT|nr:PAS domain S-box protein [Geomobilimonas luticola]
MVALGLVGACVLLCMGIPQLLAPRPYLAFWPMVVVAAEFGGIGPGLLAAVASILCVHFILNPVLGGALNLFDWVGITSAGIFFAGTSVVIIFIGRKWNLQSLQRLQVAAMESATNGIALTDVQGVLLWVNPAFCTMTGYTSMEIVGKNYRLLDSEKQNEAFYNNIWSTVLKREVWHGDLVVRRKNGTTYMEERSVAPVTNADGRLINCVIIMQDITERKRTEVVLREQADLLNLTHESILVRTMDNIITFWNKGAVIQYGWEAEEVVGKITTHDLLQTQFPLPIDEINNFLLINNFWEGELTQTKRDGSLITVLSRWALQRDKSNVPVAIMEINSDITDRKRAEEEKLILEQQFQQAQKLESLGVLSGGIAHDFNNILAIIMGHCSLIEMDYEKARDHVPEIEKAATRAAELCRQMLAYAGKAQFVQAQVNIGELVNEMVNMLRSTIKQNIEIQSTIDTDIPAIQADASQIRQVAMNLIINAAEAIGDAQGVVQVSLAKTKIKTGHSIKDYLGKLIPPGWYACLEVTDNGSGMSDETYNRIFEPFYTTKFTGRGLGMSAILGIVTTQGGNLQLFSQVGKGTTFKVYLPLLNSDSAFHEAPSLIKQAEQWRGSGTILLVEDEEPIMQVAKAMLMELGFEVIEARNGKEALHIYQQNAYDIILVMTDMGMPVMDGYNLFLELKRLNAVLPIVISSGFGDADITSRISRDDIAGLISKPYNFNLLQNVIRDAVGHAVPKHT